MPYVDNNAERRNLVLLSFAFILFQVGEGSIADNTLTLPLINVQFEDIQALKVLAVLVLCWFGLRHWQVNRITGTKEVFEEASERANSLPFRLYVRSKYGEKWKSEMRFGQGHSIEIAKEGWILRWKSPASSNSDQKENESPRSGTTETKMPIRGLSGWLAVMSIVSICAVSRPGFTSFYFPFCMFGFALINPLVS